MNLHATERQGTLDSNRARDTFGFIDTIANTRNIIATAKNDMIYGCGCANTVTGGAGDDYFNGREGQDTARFSGNSLNYNIAKLSDGTAFVTDLRAGGGDGHDMLVNVEALRFADKAVSTAALVAAAPFVAPVFVDPSPSDGFNESKSSAWVAIYFNGTPPTPEKLASLNAFANLQYEAYKAAGVLNPAIGPYEALGRGHSETIEFSTTFGAATEAAFIAANYLNVFARAPTAQQQAHFQSQIDYFEMKYENAGISSPQADLFAKGVVLGQMIGYAALDLI